MHPLKLHYLIPSLGPGGAERSLAEMLPHFRAAGIKTKIVCLRRWREGFGPEVEEGGNQVHYLEGRNLAGWILSYRRMALADRPHLVQTTLFESHVVGRLGTVGTGMPVLSSLVGLPYDRVRAADPALNHRAFWFVRQIDGWTARHLTTHFHAITHAVRDAYVDKLGLDAERIAVIERGRGLDRLGTPSPERRRAARAMLEIPEDAELLVSAGRQEFQKGHENLLHAMPEILRRRPRVILLHAGRDGQTTRRLREIHEMHGLGDRVRFLGHRDDVAEILAAADLFVFPSISEGLGGAVIEAMALGLPVVASDIPALREVVEDGRTGTLVEPQNPDALAFAIAGLLNEPSRMRSYGNHGRARFHERFEIERSAARMIELYRSLVPGFNSRHQDKMGKK